MIELSGLKPGEDIEIEFVGLRPGEKLFEELSYESEDFTPTDHPKIMRFNSQPADLELMQEHLRDLNFDLHDIEPQQLKLALQRIVPEYKPFLDSKKKELVIGVTKRRLEHAVAR
jgi:FlaA1/EpsC-like NDP-sugar epimerase